MGSELRILEPKGQFHNLQRDFRAAWDGIAANPSRDIGRGNFLFGFLATLLLEWTCRLCETSSRRRELLRGLAIALHEKDRRYFTLLPMPRVKPTRKGFSLPSMPKQRGTPLLWPLFVLIRNGLAHYYQQLPGWLADARYLWISLGGPGHGDTFDDREQRRDEHLTFCEYRADRNVGLRVWPHLLFSDVCDAVHQSDILSVCTKHKLKEERLDAVPSELLEALASAGHGTFTE